VTFYSQSLDVDISCSLACCQLVEGAVRSFGVGGDKRPKRFTRLYGHIIFITNHLDYLEVK
jgi:hypothetical protein